MGPNKTATLDVGMHHARSVSAGPSTLNGDTRLESAGACSRAQAVADILSSAIVSRRLGPGTKLVEQVLADAFGVSRTVVRQATIFLAGDGLVSIEQNRGAFVFEPNFDEALDICEALIMIEQAVAAHLVNHLRPSGWTTLKRYATQPPPAADSTVDSLAIMLDEDFHSLAVRLTGNTVACVVHARLVRRTVACMPVDEMKIDCRDMVDRRSKMVGHMERGHVSQVAAMIERHHLALLRNCFRKRPISRKMTANEVSDCLSKSADAASFSPRQLAPGLTRHKRSRSLPAGTTRQEPA